jgi:hypothetical protein
MNKKHLQKTLEMVALFGAIIGSLLLALNIPVSGWAYIPFLMSSLANMWILRGTTAPKVVMYQNVYFSAVNVIGIVRWLIL